MDLNEIDYAAIEAQALAGETDNSVPAEASTQGNTQQASTEQVPQEPSIEVELPDGTKKVFTAKEIRNGVMMQSDYTKKTTEVAEMRKAAEKVFNAYQQLQTEYDQYQSERQQLAEFLQDQDKVAQFVAKKFGAEGVKALLTHLQQPSDQHPTGLSPQQAEQLMNRKLQQMAQGFQQSQSQMQQQLREEMQRIEEEREVATYAAQITPMLQSVVQSHPILKDDPHAATILRYEVAMQHPETTGQVKELLEKAAKARVALLTKQFVDANKQAIIGKEKLKNGIEPPGGSGVVPQPKSYMKTGGTTKVNWRELEADAVARLTRR